MSLFVIPADTTLKISGTELQLLEDTLIELDEDSRLILENSLQTTLEKVDIGDVDYDDYDDTSTIIIVDDDQEFSFISDENNKNGDNMKQKANSSKIVEKDSSSDDEQQLPALAGMMNLLNTNETAKEENKQVNLAFQLFANIFSARNSPIVIAEKTADSEMSSKVEYIKPDLDAARVYEASCDTLVRFLNKSTSSVIKQQLDESDTKDIKDD